MFWILHNNVHGGTGVFHSTIIEIRNILLLLSVLRVQAFYVEWWFKGLVLVHDTDMSWPWLGSGSC
jgi:hypothetical protein